jgi:adenylate cyclase
MIEVTIVIGGRGRKFPISSTPCVIGRFPNSECPDLVLSDPFVSRRHVELTETDQGQLSVRCLGGSPIELNTGEKIEHDCEAIVDLPVGIRIGRSSLRVSKIDSGLSFLNVPASQFQMTDQTEQTFNVSRFASADSVSPDRLIQWFENLVSLQASAAGAKGLFKQAAKAVVELIGLDRCVVLHRDGDRWTVDVEHGHRHSSETVYSRSVVELVSSSKKTVYDCSGDIAGTNSLMGVSAFVGSPIMDANGEIFACLFGVRRIEGASASTGVLPIEAQLVQVIAGILSARISRLAAEAEQVRSQVQLEQFASAALVREMQSNPHWLDATERELTIMFGDIRNFSGITERLTAHQTFSLVRDVMDCMTEVIHQHGGFIFNFAGDGIAAMWNAPEPRDHHARDACRAALEIQQRLPKTVQSWTPFVGEPVRVGLGINTGKALIGNSGSKDRLKYSPLGHEVNLASRVEGATKYLGAPILITQATLDSVQDSIATRDLGEISVVGIETGVRVHEIADVSEIDREHWKAYENALRLYESGDIHNASLQARQVLTDCPDDTPTRILIKRIDEFSDSGAPWKLPSK